jgi:hypothetical protein
LGFQRNCFCILKKYLLKIIIYLYIFSTIKNIFFKIKNIILIYL